MVICHAFNSSYQNILGYFSRDTSQNQFYFYRNVLATESCQTHHHWAHTRILLWGGIYTAINLRIIQYHYCPWPPATVD
jgi:hypothetical protein